MKQTCTGLIGGAAGQGVATPGDIFAKIFARRGLHLNTYNAYQSITRGGHMFLTIRTGVEKVTNTGDKIDLLIAGGPARGPSEKATSPNFPSWLTPWRIPLRRNSPFECS